MTKCLKRCPVIRMGKRTPCSAGYSRAFFLCLPQAWLERAEEKTRAPGAAFPGIRDHRSSKSTKGQTACLPPLLAASAAPAAEGVLETLGMSKGELLSSVPIKCRIKPKPPVQLQRWPHVFRSCPPLCSAAPRGDSVWSQFAWAQAS